MSYFPIFVEMKGRPCAVVGGGSVAQRKVETLLNVGAKVTVISPRLSGTLLVWLAEGKIEHVARKYQPGDLSGFEIAFVATNDTEINSFVAQEGRERHVLVNAADDPSHCDFILPSVLRRGDLAVAVATGGKSPALARVIREELETYFTADYAELAQVVAEVRRELKQYSVKPSAQDWRESLRNGFRWLMAEGRNEEARKHLIECLRSRNVDR